MENTLTIEEWKAEQQLFEHKRTVPVYHLVPGAPHQGTENFSANKPSKK